MKSLQSHSPTKSSLSLSGLIGLLTSLLILSCLLSGLAQAAGGAGVSTVYSQPKFTGSFPSPNKLKAPLLSAGLAGAVDPTFRSGSGMNGAVQAVAVQAGVKILVGGTFTTYNSSAVGRLARLNPDSTIDPTFNPGGLGANNTVFALTPQSDGRILVGGLFTAYNGITVTYVTRLNPDGQPDPGFNTGGDGPNSGPVFALAVQNDGKIVIGGSFTTYNGTNAKRLARLNPDGSLDTTFNAGGSGADSSVNALKVQSDGKIVIGGFFSTYNGTTVNSVARLNPDGTLDTTFNPGGSGADNFVQTLVVQNDGKIVIGGGFTEYNGVAANSIARLNADGSLDTSFNPGGSGANNYVSTLAVQTDNKIVLGGYFTAYNGVAANYLARLNPDGSRDTGFGAGGAGPNNIVLSLALQGDGRLVIGGIFNRYNNTGLNSIARLNPNGSLDADFNSGGTGANDSVQSIALQSDGKILVGGAFTLYNGTPSTRLVRLNSDGSLDTAFNPGGAGANGTVLAIGVQSDGKIVIAGSFTAYNGTPADKVARLNPDGSLDTSFNVGGSGANNSILTLALQSDGKIVLGGYFTIFNDTAASYIVRLNSDGTRDATFNIGNGLSDAVSALVVQGDGKIVIGGIFNTSNGLKSIARLNSDGTFDATFNPGGGASGNVLALALQSDGKILVGGYFTGYSGAAAPRLIRINPNGSRDTSFNAGGSGPNFGVLALLLQSDGKVVIGGGFTAYNGANIKNVARLNSDGSLDTDFDAGGTGPTGSVLALALQTDGRILIGGSFRSVDTYTRDNLARLVGMVRAASTVTLSSNPNPSQSGESVTFTATVQPASATGSVIFTFGSAVSNTSVTAPVVGGAASYVTSTLPLGLTPVQASYGGDSAVQPGTSAIYTQTVTVGPPAQIVAVSGSGQSAVISTTFAQPLVARVTDAGSNPVSGASVGFVAPGSGASGTFIGGSSVYTGTTDASGVVTSSAFTANGLIGSYVVTASVAGVSTPASFSLTNQAGCNPLLVTSNLDDGSCGTLRQAVSAASASQGSRTISISLAAGSVITLTTGLTLPDNAVITTTASCGTGLDNLLLPPIILQGAGANSGPGLTLAVNNQLYGLWVRGFSGVQIKAPAGSHSALQCVRASKT